MSQRRDGPVGSGVDRSRRRSTRIPASSPVNHVTYVTVVKDDDERRVGDVRVCRGLHGRDDRLGLRGVGQRLVLPAVRRLLRRLSVLLPVPAHLRHGRLVQPVHRRLRARLRGVRPVRRRRHGRVLQSAHRHLRARRRGLRSVRVARRRLRPTTRAPGTYAQTRQGSNVYGNWGTSSVQRGDDWAQTAHRENYRTGRRRPGSAPATAAVRFAPAVRAASTTVGRTGSGDVYAGHDGNVYRRTDGGGWEQNNGSGGWTPTTGEGAQPRQGAATGDAARSPNSGSTNINQLDRDSSARTEGNDRTTTRSSWERGGSTRSGAGSYGGARARPSGGGRRR